MIQYHCEDTQRTALVGGFLFPQLRRQMEKRLEEIIHDIYEIGYDNGSGSREPVHEKDKIEEIKFVFKDAGYHEPVTFYSPIIRQQPHQYMTGQEWLESLEKTLVDLFEGNPPFASRQARDQYYAIKELLLQELKNDIGIK